MSDRPASIWPSKATQSKLRLPLATVAVAVCVTLACAIGPASTALAGRQAQANPAAQSAGGGQATSPPAKTGQQQSAAGCANCHAGIVASYAHAGMSHALETPGADPVLAQHPAMAAQVGSYAYKVETRDGKSTYSVSDGQDTLTLPIRWNFGQHSQTWVLEKDGQFYESQVSFFRREQGLATTPGDDNLKPQNLTDAIGRKVSVWELMQCFNCHGTGGTTGDRLTLDKLRPGLSCERCHDGANEHMADALQKNFSTVPRSLGRMNAEDTSEFCGQCHRTWDAAVRNHWHGQADVRFQPYRLANSRCYIGTDRRISCTACHDPHQAVNTSVESYDGKCLACHTAPAKTVPATAAVVKVCPVAKSKCASCHMPQVELPGGHGVFTDHEIRVVRAGAPYPD